MALGALIIKARLGLTDEELVEQIKENPYLQFFIGLEAFQYSAPFDPSMMVYFRKRLPEVVVNDCNERIVRHGLKVIRSSDSQDPGDDSHNDGGSASPVDQPRPSSQKQPNQGSLLFDATGQRSSVAWGLTCLLAWHGGESFPSGAHPGRSCAARAGAIGVAA